MGQHRPAQAALVEKVGSGAVGGHRGLSGDGGQNAIPRPAGGGDADKGSLASQLRPNRTLTANAAQTSIVLALASRYLSNA